MILAVVTALAPGRALAESAALAEARQMLEQQEFEDALSALDGVRQTGELDPSELVELYRAQAECAAALRRPEEARDAFVNLLVIDPDYYVPTGESPLVREPFEQAQTYWRSHNRPTARYSPPSSIAGGEPFVLTLGEGAAALSEVISQLTLHIRPVGGEYSVVEGEGASLEVDSDLFRGADAVELYLVVRDDQGNIAGRAGSEDEPLQVEVGEGEGGSTRPPRERRWYRRWWVWTIIGAVVVGVAVGVPLGLTQGGEGDPCEALLGGQCDLEVRLNQ